MSNHKNIVTFIAVPEWNDATQNNIVDMNNVFEGSMPELFECLDSADISSNQKHAVPMLIPALFDDEDYEQAERTVKQSDGTRIKMPLFDDNNERCIRRSAVNILCVCMLSADFDDNMTVEEAEEMFKDYSYIIYTTFNHLADGVTHKFRMLFEIKEYIAPDDLANRKDSLQAFMAGADPSTTDLARGFFVPCVNTTNDVDLILRINAGKAIDVLTFAENVAPIIARPTGGSFKPMNTKDMNDIERAEIIDLLTNSVIDRRSEWFKMVTALKGLDFDEFEVLGISAGNHNHFSSGTGVKTSAMCSDAYASSHNWEAGACMGTIINIIRNSGHPDFRKLKKQISTQVVDKAKKYNL